MELAQQEFAIHKRNERILSVVLLDLDHFKKINDIYGHAVGDKALVYFANLCRDSLRSADIFGRLDGEKFSIALPDTGIDGAYMVGERLRKSLESFTAYPEMKHPSMTVSIGAATMGDEDLFSTMMDNADTALDEAKNSGRNTVVSFEEEKIAE